MGGSPVEVLRSLLGTVVAELEGEAFTATHALVLGAVDANGSGSWPAVERATVEAHRALATTPADPAAVRAAGAAWRRDRRLLAGADLRAWLSARRLDTAGWRGFLERRVGAPPVGSDPDRADPGATPIDDEVVAALAVDLRCAGLLERLADRLLAGAAAERALAADAGAALPAPGDPGRRAAAAAATTVARAAALTAADLLGPATRVEALEAAHAAFTARIEAVAIEDRLRDRRLDWTELTWEEVAFPSEGAAREAAFMVEVDGEDLAAPARLAAADLRRRRGELGRLDPETSRLLVGTAAGQVVGPRAGPDGWRLLRIIERVEPSAADAALLARARHEVATDRLAVHRSGARVVA